MPRFMEEDDDRFATCCDGCGRYINEDNAAAEFTWWDNAIEKFGSPIDGCHACHLEMAKENALAFLKINALEDAMMELAEALGIKVGA